MPLVAATVSPAPGARTAAAQSPGTPAAAAQDAAAQDATVQTATAQSAKAQAAAGNGTIDLGSLGLGSIDLSRIDVLKTSLAGSGLLIGLVVAFAVVSLIVRRFRKPAIATLADPDGSCGICARVWAWFRQMLDAIDYVSTRREWRYAQPWLLVLGERGSGKSSLIASVSAASRYPPPARADELHAEGMRWSYFRNGVLIDSDGALASADDGTPEARQWDRGLTALNALRPERPLDGIVLCVSARSLHGPGRAAAAENVFRQMNQLQSRVEFMLPAYVVVTQCDHVPGFASFWRNQAPARRGEMVGYSAVAADQDRAPSDWTGSAFERIGARMREIQTDVASRGENIDDVDGFFLFPKHLGALRDPLTHWLETVFRTSAWQSGYLFRGLYFTGSVEANGTSASGAVDEVDFVDALIANKALSEPALARPTRQGIWSRNLVIRRLQVAAVAAAVGLLVALVATGYKVSQQVEAVVSAIDSVDKIAPRVPAIESGECLAREDIYPLLTQVSRIDTRSRYAAIPLSWVDHRLTSRSATAVGRSTVRKVLMPTLSCLLEQRSRDLLATARLPTTATASGLSRERADFRKLVADARSLEDNLARFQTLSKGNDALDESELIGVLNDLASYTFGEALPSEVRRKDGLLDDAFREIDDVRDPVMPNGLNQRVAATMEARSASLRAALSREVSVGDDLLILLNDGRPSIVDNTRRMGLWLSWVQRSWLGSSPERNPCREIVDANKADIEALIAHYGNLPGMTGILQRFGEQQCRQPEMRTLATMTLAPYGPMFVSGEQGLMLAPELQGELSGLPALVELPYMQRASPRPFACVGAAADWRADALAEAAGYLRQYEAFVKSRKLPPLADGGRPLYDSLARASLGHALDDALRRAQTLPVDSISDEQTDIRSEAHLARVGEEMARGEDALEAVLGAYATYGLSDGGAGVRRCASAFAADNLGGVHALAEESRLYSPPVAAGNGAMFTLPGLSATGNFLARQVARAESLSSYADPFLAVLDDTPGVDGAWRDASQTAAFWRNTRQEIERHAKGKDPAGQVAHLEAYFVNQLSGMSYANCASLLAAYTSPEYGDDLFSDRRRILERHVQLRCTDQRQAQAESVYEALATRFNRDLAGRYPFGEPDSRDAGVQAVRAFLLDYAERREGLGAALAAMNGDRWRAAKAFVAELDAVAAFFSGNLGAPGQADAVGVGATFQAEPSRSVGGDQLVTWRLAVEDGESVFPNGLKPLYWMPEDRLALHLSWATRSQWRPLVDPAQPGLGAEGVTASFNADGPWALLRFIDTYRLPNPRSKAPGQILLGFRVPVQSVTVGEDGKPAQGETRVFMTWALTAVDPKTQTEKTIVLPGAFPLKAPVEWRSGGW